MVGKAIVECEFWIKFSFNDFTADSKYKLFWREVVNDAVEDGVDGELTEIVWLVLISVVEEEDGDNNDEVVVVVVAVAVAVAVAVVVAEGERASCCVLEIAAVDNELDNVEAFNTLLNAVVNWEAFKFSAEVFKDEVNNGAKFAIETEDNDVAKDACVIDEVKVLISVVKSEGSLGNIGVCEVIWDNVFANVAEDDGEAIDDVSSEDGEAIDDVSSEDGDDIDGDNIFWELEGRLDSLVIDDSSFDTVVGSFA